MISKCLRDRVIAGVAIPIALGTAVWLFIVMAYAWMGWSIDRSDLQNYIQWSYHLQRHTDYPSHMPGFSLLILIARTVSLHHIPDTVVAQMVGYLCWLSGVFLSRDILKVVAPQCRRLGMLLFGLFPLVGVTSASNPNADLPAYVCGLGALYFALQKRWWQFCVFTSLGLLVHQAFYPLFLSLALVCVLNRKMPWRYFIACGIPFIGYYTVVAIARRDANWILSFHAAVHAPRAGDFLLFSGILGTALRGTLKYALKAALLLCACLGSFLLSGYCLRRKNWLMVAMCVPVVLACALSPQNVCWVIFRLSKLLVFPACWWLAAHPRIMDTVDKVSGYALGAIVLVVSQLFWGYYGLVYFGWSPP